MLLFASLKLRLLPWKFNWNWNSQQAVWNSALIYPKNSGTTSISVFFNKIASQRSCSHVGNAIMEKFFVNDSRINWHPFSGLHWFVLATHYALGPSKVVRKHYRFSQEISLRKKCIQRKLAILYKIASPISFSALNFERKNVIKENACLIIQYHLLKVTEFQAS